MEMKKKMYKNRHNIFHHNFNNTTKGKESYILMKLVIITNVGIQNTKQNMSTYITFSQILKVAYSKQRKGRVLLKFSRNNIYLSLINLVL